MKEQGRRHQSGSWEEGVVAQVYHSQDTIHTQFKIEELGSLTFTVHQYYISQEHSIDVDEILKALYDQRMNNHSANIPSLLEQAKYYIAHPKGFYPALFYYCTAFEIAKNNGNADIEKALVDQIERILQNFVKNNFTTMQDKDKVIEHFIVSGCVSVLIYLFHSKDYQALFYDDNQKKYRWLSELMRLMPRAELPLTEEEISSPIDDEYTDESSSAETSTPNKFDTNPQAFRKGLNEIGRFLILETKMDITTGSWGDEPNSLLHKAIQQGCFEIAEILIKHDKADEHFLRRQQSRSRDTALHIAAKQGYLRLIEMLVEKDKDLLLIKNGLNEIPVISALRDACHGNWKVKDEVCYFLLKQNYDFQLYSSNSKELLFWAIDAVLPNTVRLLVDQYAHLFDKTDFSYVANCFVRLDNVYNLSRIGKKKPEEYQVCQEIAYFLITHGFCIDGESYEPLLRGNTVLHAAAWLGLHQLVSLLLEKGLIPRKNNAEQYPLHRAAENPNDVIDTVNLLLKERDTGINHCQHYCQWTPLHLAAKQGNWRIVDRLLKYNKDTINNQDYAGNTPLHLAAKAEQIRYSKGKEKEESYLSIIRCLLRSGANIDLLNSSNRKADDGNWVATQNIYKEILKHRQTNASNNREIEANSDSMTQFEAYLREHYKNDVDCHSVNLLFGGRKHIEDCFVNLAIVKQAKQREKTKEALAKETQSQSLDRERYVSWYEDIHRDDDKEPIKIEELFNERMREDKNNRRKRFPKKILVHGWAGIGKTTLLRKIAYEWATEKLWKDKFKFVLWIRLRHLNTGKNAEHKTLDTLIEAELFDKTGKYKLTTEQFNAIINKQHPNETLFLIDGYDELNTDTESATIIHQVLQKEWHIIVTSRPTVIINAEFDSVLETIGFTDENIAVYIKQFFKDDSEQGKKIINFLKINPSIYGLAHIPISLELICSVFEKDIPQTNTITMTELYQKVEAKLWERVVKKITSQDGYRVGKLTKEQKEDQKCMRRYLPRLAFYSMTKNHYMLPQEDLEVVIQEIYPDVELPEEMVDYLQNILFQGFLHCPDTDEHHKVYYFSHSTLQEFFAARYLSEQLLSQDKEKVEEAKDFIKNHKYEQRLQYVFWFTVGLLNIEANHENGRYARDGQKAVNQFFACFFDAPRDLAGTYESLFLIRCLEEGQLLKKIDEKYLNQIWNSVYVIIWYVLHEQKTLSSFFKRITDTFSQAPQVLQSIEIENYLERVFGRCEEEYIKIIPRFPRYSVDSYPPVKQVLLVVELLLKVTSQSRPEFFKKIADKIFSLFNILSKEQDDFEDRKILLKILIKHFDILTEEQQNKLLKFFEKYLLDEKETSYKNTSTQWKVIELFEDFYQFGTMKKNVLEILFKILNIENYYRHNKIAVLALLFKHCNQLKSEHQKTVLTVLLQFLKSNDGNDIYETREIITKNYHFLNQNIQNQLFEQLLEFLNPCDNYTCTSEIQWIFIGLIEKFDKRQQEELCQKIKIFTCDCTPAETFQFSESFNAILIALTKQYKPELRKFIIDEVLVKQWLYTDNIKLQKCTTKFFIGNFNDLDENQNNSIFQFSCKTLANSNNHGEKQKTATGLFENCAEIILRYVTLSAKGDREKVFDALLACLDNRCAWRIQLKTIETYKRSFKDLPSIQQGIFLDRLLTYSISAKSDSEKEQFIKPVIIHFDFLEESKQKKASELVSSFIEKNVNHYFGINIEILKIIALTPMSKINPIIESLFEIFFKKREPYWLVNKYWKKLVEILIIHVHLLSERQKKSLINWLKNNLMPDDSWGESNKPQIYIKYFEKLSELQEEILEVLRQILPKGSRNEMQHTMQWLVKYSFYNPQQKDRNILTRLKGILDKDNLDLYKKTNLHSKSLEILRSFVDNLFKIKRSLSNIQFEALYNELLEWFDFIKSDSDRNELIKDLLDVPFPSKFGQLESDNQNKLIEKIHQWVTEKKFQIGIATLENIIEQSNGSHQTNIIKILCFLIENNEDNSHFNYMRVFFKLVDTLHIKDLESELESILHESLKKPGYSYTVTADILNKLDRYPWNKNKIMNILYQLISNDLALKSNWFFLTGLSLSILSKCTKLFEYSDYSGLVQQKARKEGIAFIVADSSDLSLDRDNVIASQNKELKIIEKDLLKESNEKLFIDYVDSADFTIQQDNKLYDDTIKKYSYPITYGFQLAWSQLKPNERYNPSYQKDIQPLHAQSRYATKEEETKKKFGQQTSIESETNVVDNEAESSSKYTR